MTNDKDKEASVNLRLNKIDNDMLVDICNDAVRNRANMIRYLIRKEWKALNRISVTGRLVDQNNE